MNKTDYGGDPYVLNMEEVTIENDYFREVKWTGTHLQMTVMCIDVGGEVGLEVHKDTDQFLRLEQGQARVEMGPKEDDLSFVREVEDGHAICIPAGMWHNIVNIGEDELKLYSIYGPPEHSYGTVHQTYADDPEHVQA